MKEQPKKKRKALCEICNNPVKKYQAVLIKSQDIPKSYKRSFPYKKLRHEDCLICIVCKEPTNPRNFKFIGSHQYGVGYCKDTCYPGSSLWLESDIGKSSPLRECFKRENYSSPIKEKSKAKTEKKKSKKISDLSHQDPEVKELLKLLAKSKNPKESRKLRRKLRKKGVYISNLKNPDRLKRKLKKRT